jgi:hypothetical protein
MPIYAQRADVEDFIDGWVTDDPSALDALIERAERDVDTYCGPWSVEANGLKFGDPATGNEKGLTDGQVLALTRATCAQVEYRFVQGEEFMARAQYTQVKGPDFETHGQLPYIGPKVRRELDDAGLVRQTSIRAVPMGNFPAEPWEQVRGN